MNVRFFCHACLTVYLALCLGASFSEAKPKKTQTKPELQARLVKAKSKLKKAVQHKAAVKTKVKEKKIAKLEKKIAKQRTPAKVAEIPPAASNDGELTLEDGPTAPREDLATEISNEPIPVD